MVERDNMVQLRVNSDAQPLPELNTENNVLVISLLNQFSESNFVFLSDTSSENNIDLSFDDKAPQDMRKPSSGHSALAKLIFIIVALACSVVLIVAAVFILARHKVTCKRALSSPYLIASEREDLSTHYSLT